MIRTLPLRARRLFNAPRLLPLLLSPLLANCLGDQFGGAQNGGDESMCVDFERHPVDLDDVLPMGFRARDIIDFALGDFEMPFALSVPSGASPDLTVVPEGNTTLQLRVDSTASRATYIDRRVDPAESQDFDCADYVEVDASLTLTAANGAFEDTLPVVLRARHVTESILTVALNPGAMRGSFDLIQKPEDAGSGVAHQSMSSPEGQALKQTLFELRLSPSHASGTLVAHFEHTSAEGKRSPSSLTLFQTAEEDRTACYTEDFVGALDEGAAVSRLRAVLNESPKLLFSFADGNRQDIVLQASFQPIPPFCLEGTFPPHLGVAATVVLMRAGSDAPIATWALDGSAHYTSDGRFQRIGLDSFQELEAPFDPAEAAATTLDLGLDLSNADQLTRWFWLHRDDSGEWVGLLEINGSHDERLAEATVEEVK